MVVQISLTLVSTTTVGSGGAASIEFTNIPQTGKDLLLLLSARSTSDGSVTGQACSIKFNNSSSDFSYRFLAGDGSTAFSGGASGAIVLLRVNGSASTANTFSNSQMIVSNYTSSAAKSFSADGVAENNATAARNDIGAQLWNNTAAITSLAIAPSDAGSFAQHSTASLYLIS